MVPRSYHHTDVFQQTLIYSESKLRIECQRDVTKEKRRPLFAHANGQTERRMYRPKKCWQTVYHIVQPGEKQNTDYGRCWLLMRQINVNMNLDNLIIHRLP